MKKMIYKVTIFGGYVGFIAARSLEEAKKQAMSESGSLSVQRVELASSLDIEWAKGMGMQLPKTEPVRPSEWAREGYYVVEGRNPKAGDHCDYYDRDGIKRSGTIVSYDGETIVIDGERKKIVRETFKVRQGR